MGRSIMMIAVTVEMWPKKTFLFVHMDFLVSWDHVLRLLLLAELEVLGTLDGLLGAVLAALTFHPPHNLFGGLGLLVKDGLGLSTETGLLSVVTALSLGKLGGFARLVLGNLEPLMRLAL